MPYLRGGADIKWPSYRSRFALHLHEGLVRLSCCISQEGANVILEKAWRKVAQECPRRILGELHRNGTYRHGTSARFPRKILCLHRQTPAPAGWIPTDAQAEATCEAVV